MTGMETLRLCRASLEAMDRQAADVEMLKGLCDAEVNQQTMEQIIRQREQSGEVLRGQKQMYTMRSNDALKVLRRLQGREKRVLWMYYVLGMTIKTISANMGLNYRDVLKCKAKAIKTLEDTEEDEHESSDDHR